MASKGYLPTSPGPHPVSPRSKPGTSVESPTPYLIELPIQLGNPLSEDNLIMHIPPCHPQVPKHSVPPACPLSKYRGVQRYSPTCTIPCVPLGQPLDKVRQADAKNFFLVTVPVPGFKGIDRVSGRMRDIQGFYLSMVSEKALGTSFLTSSPSHLECEANMLNLS